MLNPAGACTAHCAYCFGPNTGPLMDEATLGAALDWIERVRQPDQTLELVLHGGEPLLAGVAWYRQALPQIRTRFGPGLRLSMQSNLWLLDDAFWDLIEEYAIGLGTSLDGPQPINDAQRGQGSFVKTMRGIEIARGHGIGVGIICTFTRQSAERWQEIFDFFLSEGLSFSFHGAIPTLDGGTTGSLALTADGYARLFTAMFDYYLTKIKHIRVDTLDQLARGLTGHCTVCTFGPCLGRYLSISSDGGIYPCNRFAPHPAWRLGAVQDRPAFEDLAGTSAWQHLKEREASVKHDCGDCAWFSNCSGGCAYHALAAGTDRRDGYCQAYQRIFAHVTDRVLSQVFSEDNLAAVVAEGSSDQRGLLRRGELLQVMRGGPHPSSTITRAREAAAAVALAVCGSPAAAFGRLEQVGLITRPQDARVSLDRLWQRLRRLPQNRNEAYVHVTYACNLTCSHCYATGGPARSAESMSVAQVRAVLAALIEHSFQRIKITGGEPLMHPHWTEIQDLLISLRSAGSGSQVVLRTNLTLPLSAADLDPLVRCVDHIIVSIDGDQASHDARRGTGAYARTVKNLRDLVQVCGATPVSIAATITNEQAHGQPGRSVRALGAELNCEVRFRPLLPLGRGRGLSLPAGAGLPTSTGIEALDRFHARNSCSLGQNLHFDVNGDCYPCFALLGEEHRLGNIFAQGLGAIMDRNARYSQCTVDTNRQCRGCVWRYLCGGSCRIGNAGEDPNEPPLDCAALERRSALVLGHALDVLGVDRHLWRDAGLPEGADRTPQ